MGVWKSEMTCNHPLTLCEENTWLECCPLNHPFVSEKESFRLGNLRGRAGGSNLPTATKFGSLDIIWFCSRLQTRSFSILFLVWKQPNQTLPEKQAGAMVLSLQADLEVGRESMASVRLPLALPGNSAEENPRCQGFGVPPTRCWKLLRRVEFLKRKLLTWCVVLLCRYCFCPSAKSWRVLGLKMWVSKTFRHEGHLKENTSIKTNLTLGLWFQHCCPCTRRLQTAGENRAFFWYALIWPSSLVSTFQLDLSSGKGGFHCKIWGAWK